MTVTDDQIDQFLAAASPFIGQRSSFSSSRRSVFEALRSLWFGSDMKRGQTGVFQGLQRSGTDVQARAGALVAGDCRPRPA